MLISHRCRFIFFSDPLLSCDWVNRALAPWADQGVAVAKRPWLRGCFYQGMSPDAAKRVFDQKDMPFAGYTRIALVENPFRRMVHQYDQLAVTDPVWRLRQAIGLELPTFTQWLKTMDTTTTVQPFLSATKWAGGHIGHFIRAEFAEQDLRPVLQTMGVRPLMAPPDQSTPVQKFREMLRYDQEAIDIVRRHFSDDLTLYHSPTPYLRLVA